MLHGSEIVMRTWQHRQCRQISFSMPQLPVSSSALTHTLQITHLLGTKTRISPDVSHITFLSLCTGSVQEGTGLTALEGRFNADFIRSFIRAPAFGSWHASVEQHSPTLSVFCCWQECVLLPVRWLSRLLFRSATCSRSWAASKAAPNFHSSAVRRTSEASSVARSLALGLFEHSAKDARCWAVSQAIESDERCWKPEEPRSGAAA